MYRIKSESQVCSDPERGGAAYVVTICRSIWRSRAARASASRSSCWRVIASASSPDSVWAASGGWTSTLIFSC